MSNAWHALSREKVLSALGVMPSGLSRFEVTRRREQYGSNVLPEDPVKSVLRVFLEQFRSPLIYLLCAAAVVVAYLGDAVDAGIIVAVLFFNAVIGSVQEYKARTVLLALKKHVVTNATVFRDGKEMIVPDYHVVPGDILIVREGDKIAADCRMIDSQSCEVDESSLTGESLPVEKRWDAVVSERALVAEQSTMLFRGTHVVMGQARAVVVATGAYTVIGAIVSKAVVVDEELPLKKEIAKLSRVILVAVGVVSGVLFVVGLGVGQDPRALVVTLVSLATSVVPEGLPVVLTIVLATGVARMARRRALIKKLQAVEALGQADVVAVDKTGTITMNQLVIERVWTHVREYIIEGSGFEPVGDVRVGGIVVNGVDHTDLMKVARLSALCANGFVTRDEATGDSIVTGDPTEVSLGVFGEKLGFKKEELLAESPFVSEIVFDRVNKYHATIHRGVEGNILTVIGAPETVLQTCVHVERERDDIENTAARYAEMGYRVLACATRKKVPDAMSAHDMHGLTFVGLVALRDSLCPGVRDTVEQIRAAGMRVVMITGDHALTARAIARDAGIFRDGDRVVTGQEIATMSQVELDSVMEATTVFARVAPEHKMMIIESHKRRGEIIAMTGDGVNDVPALMAAHLGVAMGLRGTDVAKEAADIILLDDNLQNIVAAIEEGRAMYANIRKVIMYLFSTNVSEVGIIFCALVFGYPVPLLAGQIIWLNFVTDGFLDVSLAMEPKEHVALRRKIRHGTHPLFSVAMGFRMCVMAIVMIVGTMAVYTYYLGAEPSKALTMSLTVLAAFQWFNAWNCRSDHESLFRTNPFQNMYLVAATIFVVALQMTALYVPVMQRVLHTVPLDAGDWMIAGGVACTVVLAEEMRKVLTKITMGGIDMDSKEVRGGGVHSGNM